jgi:hypothetical protein
MYVEISPRQSGKTTRLIEAAISYLRQDDYARIAIVTSTFQESLLIKKKLKIKIHEITTPNWGGRNENLELLIHEFYLTRVDTVRDVNSLRGLRVDYYFFDDFSYLEPRKIMLNNSIIENGYYCTTPTDKRSTINMITNYCLINDININYFNTWTESRLREQEALSPYVREHVLEYWSNYMESIGITTNELKENWLTKIIKKHNFV